MDSEVMQYHIGFSFYLRRHKRVLPLIHNKKTYEKHITSPPAAFPRTCHRSN